MFMYLNGDFEFTLRSVIAKKGHGELKTYMVVICR